MMILINHKILMKLKHWHIYKGLTMIKQLFNNIFDKKNAKLEFKPHFVSGTLSYKSITDIKSDKCKLDFENQAFKISQNDKILSDKMSNVRNIRTWIFKERLYLAIETKSQDEYMFSFPDVEISDFAMNLLLKPLEMYAKEFTIPFEYQGVSEDDE